LLPHGPATLALVGSEVAVPLLLLQRWCISVDVIGSSGAIIKSREWMLISARYGIHGRNPRYALRICSSGRAAVTAAALTKVQERGIRGRGRAGERKGERWRRNRREEEEGSGWHDTRRISCRAASFATRAREIFSLQANHDELS
jgi:hypothetical protein